MIMLDGKSLAQKKYKLMARKVEEFKAKYNRRPKLSVIIVGDDPASHVYVNNKKLACDQVGMESEILRLPAQTTEKAIHEAINRLNADETVDGFLVQMPLPESLKGFEPSDYISPDKDVDGLSALNIGLMSFNKAFHEPCTPEGVMELLKHYEMDLVGKQAVVVGRSTTVGWPMAFMLTRADCTVTVCHSRTEDIKGHIKNADIVVVAAGKPHLLKIEDFKKDAVIIDVGIHKNPSGKGLVGDVDFSNADKETIKAMSPVPGGVGPMTVAQLIEHTYNAAIIAEKKRGKEHG